MKINFHSRNKKIIFFCFLRFTESRLVSSNGSSFSSMERERETERCESSDALLVHKAAGLLARALRKRCGLIYISAKTCCGKASRSHRSYLLIRMRMRYVAYVGMRMRHAHHELRPHTLTSSEQSYQLTVCGHAKGHKSGGSRKYKCSPPPSIPHFPGPLIRRS